MRLDGRFKYVQLQETSAPTNTSGKSVIYHDSSNDTLKCKINDDTADYILYSLTNPTSYPFRLGPQSMSGSPTGASATWITPVGKIKNIYGKTFRATHLLASMRADTTTASQYMHISFLRNGTPITGYDESDAWAISTNTNSDIISRLFRIALPTGFDINADDEITVKFKIQNFVGSYVFFMFDGTMSL